MVPDEWLIKEEEEEEEEEEEDKEEGKRRRKERWSPYAPDNRVPRGPSTHPCRLSVAIIL